MVALVVALKWRLLRNGLKRSGWQLAGLIFGGLYGAGIVIAIFAALVGLRWVDDLDGIRMGLVLGGALITLGWWLIPLVAFGTDATLDPNRFATFAVPARRLVPGLACAALIGLPGIATMLLLLGTVISWSRSLPATLIALAAALIAALTMVAGGRLLGTAMAKVMQSRRGRDVTALVTVVLGVALGPLFAVASTDRSMQAIGERLGTVVDVVAWTPLGWAFAAPADAAAGQWAMAIVRLGLAAGFLWLLFELWARVLATALENPALSTTGRSESVGSDLGLLGRLPGTATGAVAARVAMYWRRDPRFQSGFLITPLIPLIMLLPYYLSPERSPLFPLLMAPAGAFLIGWSEHNNVAYDSTALWMHISAGVDPRADRIGRLVPSMVTAALVAVVYSVAGCLIAGSPQLIPAAFALAVGLAGAGFGMSMVSSTLKPYPVPAPGDSPFNTPSGAAGITMVVQTVGMFVVVALAAPLLVLGWFAWTGATWAVWTMVPVGLVMGAGYLSGGLRWGAALFERRGADVLAELAAIR